MDIDRSLDEIIKQNKTAKGKPKQNGGAPTGRGGKGGRGRGGGRGGAGGGRGKVANGRNGKFQNGDNYKKFAGSNGVKNKAAKKPVRRLESVSTGRKIHKAVAPIQGSGTLQVSNLHFNVSDSDVRDLFGEVGKIKKSHLHYDQSGRSLGTADVTYDRRSDAIKAMKQYNGVPLDGKPMKIELASGTAQADFGGQIRSHLGIKPSGMKFNYSKGVANGGGIVKKKGGKVAGRGGKMVGGGNTRGGGKIRGGGKAKGGGKLAEGGKVKAGAKKGLKKKVPKEAKKAPTAEELDKEMDDYQSGRS